VPALRALLPDGTFLARPGLPAAVGVRGLLAFGFFGNILWEKAFWLSWMLLTAAGSSREEFSDGIAGGIVM